MTNCDDRRPLTSVVSLLSTLDGVRGCPVLGPRGAETGTLRDHATTLRRGQALSPSKHVRDDSIPLERCFAPSASDKMPLLPPPVFPSTPQITWPLLRAPEFLLCGTLLLLLLYILAPCHSGPFSITPWRGSTLQEISSSRARIKGSESNKDTVNGEEVKKELQDATKRGYRRALAL